MDKDIKPRKKEQTKKRKKTGPTKKKHMGKGISIENVNLGIFATFEVDFIL